MNALIYLYKRTFLNKMKKALHKPVTYVYVAIIVLYVFLLPTSFRIMFESWKMDSPEGLTIVLTIFAFWIVPANLIAYAKRKGLIFRGSDIHFLFPSPVSPKKALLYAHVRTLLAAFLINIVLIIAGVYIFRVELWRMLLYFVFSIVVENLLEGSIMLLMYGSERISERMRTLAVKCAYALVGVLVALGIFVYITQGLGFQSVLNYLQSDLVQMVPLIGWYIAVLRLLFVGPTVVNVICSALYLLLAIVVVYAAIRMKCTGEYFEDAVKFAEDYEEVLSSRRAGRTDKRLGKRQKFGRAKVEYKGSYGKAIFYRQLLEYKKSKYFIFDINTVMCLLFGVGAAFVYVREGGFGAMTDFILPLLMAYLILIFTAYNGKWGKELLSPYTFMIPDTPVRKLWYATLLQHVSSLINGCLFVLPCAVVMKMNPLTAVLSVLAYTVLSACKLYIYADVQILMGDILGNTGRQLFQMLMIGIAIGIAALGALAGFLLGGLNLAYIMMIVMLCAETAGFMALASMGFYRMETAQG